MTTAEGWTGAVRARLGLGRLLPLGTAQDGAWLAERAAEPVLRRAAAEVPGVVPGTIRTGLADPGSAGTPAVPPPPAALPPGPLRIEAEFASATAAPLPELAEQLRTALLTAAGEHLGLPVTVVDLRVTTLLDAPPEPAGAPAPVPAPGSEGLRPEEAPAAAKEPGDGARAGDALRGSRGTAAAERPVEGAAERRGGAGAAEPRDVIAAAAAAVPGVARLTGTLGAAVRVEESGVRVECATASGHRPVEVARAVRAAVTSVLLSPLPVTVLVTEVDCGA
ncbi:hypothetical protein [Streptomyces wuyuanensis]|uniref:Nucleopolyhedrovirus P10 family protein n=1 Tax=Streptomyces wuyuanensis TaxID=1196353 RepID=A0A1G9QIB8_9ACTN|nr:hypothetical protein [Streptomyces wuyuanensis]SDM10716.1 hypothetical protein SAMN05444921_10452 [Streptomyces wuyuanensis]